MMTSCPKDPKQSDIERWHKNHEEQLDTIKKTRDQKFKEMVIKLIGETHPEVKLSDISPEKLRSLGAQAHLLSLDTNDKLKSVGENPHIQFNWGQFQESPTTVLGIAQVCKIVLMAERIERGFITHKHYGEQYLGKHPQIEKAIGAMSFVHLGLSAGHTAQSLYTLYKTIDKTDLKSINIFNAAIDAASHAGDFTGDVFEKLDILCSLPSVIKRFGAHTRFGAIASVLAPLSAGLSVFTQARSWFDPNISTAVKIIGSIETGVGATGKVAGVIATAVWLDRARRAADALKAGNTALHATLTASKASVVGALAASIVAAVFTPLQIYSIHEEFNYAKQLDKLAEEFSKYGYNGHALLAELYRNKATLDSVTTALQTTLTLVGGGASLAMMASGVGAPLALAIGVITTTVSILIDSVNQGVLENIANQQRTEILKWEKNNNNNYFSVALDAHYEALKPQLVDTLQHVQDTWNVDQIVAVIQTKTDTQTHELAALTRLAEKTLSGKAYIDVFKNGTFSADKKVTLDTENGIINLKDNNLKQGLIFVQPLLTPGIEARARKSQGKNEFITELNLLSRDGWTINDLGTAATKADFSGVVQRIKTKNHSLKEITITANMGDGDDLVIASAGKMVIDGGTGNNAVDYSQLSKDFSLTISAENNTKNHYHVEKQANQTQVLEESIFEKQINYGKNKEKVQYRDALITTSACKSIDTLSHVQTIKASKGNDIMKGSSWDDDFHGDDGNDTIKTGAGNDIAYGGKGHDHIEMGSGDDLAHQDITVGDNDFLCGGDGNDTINYSVTELVKAVVTNGKKTITFDAKTFIHVDLEKGYVEKYREGFSQVDKQLIGKDTLKKFENLIATQGNDIIHMDASDNTVYGLDGDDNINTYAGQDIVVAGKGNDIIDTGADDDIILQNIDQENDSIDGGTGNDTVNYGVSAFKDNQHHKDKSKISRVGIQVDLKAGIAFKYITHNNQLVRQIKDEKNAHLVSDGHEKKDILKNIENIDATALDDTILGDNHSNKIKAGAGNDMVNGREGDDVIDAGDGDDIVYGGSGSDLIIGGHGHDEIFAGADDDIIMQMVDEEKDKIDGGDGFDIVDYSKVASAEERRIGQALTIKDGIVVNLASHYATKYMTGVNGQAIYQQDSLHNIEGVVGTLQNDTLRGDHNDNLLDGADGDDLIHGRQGNDRLKGGKGHDTYEFSLGDGQDIIEEDGGRDKIKLLSITHANQVTVHKKENNLVIRFTDAGVEHNDTITVLGHFSNEKQAIEEIVLGNNISYDVSALVQAAAGSSPLETPHSWSFNLNALTPSAPTLVMPI